MPEQLATFSADDPNNIIDCDADEISIASCFCIEMHEPAHSLSWLHLLVWQVNIAALDPRFAILKRPFDLCFFKFIPFKNV